MIDWPLTREAAGQFLRPLAGADAFLLLLRAGGGEWTLAFRHGQLSPDLALQAAQGFDPEEGGTVSALPGGGWLARYSGAAPQMDLCLLAGFSALTPDQLQASLEALEERVGWILVAALRDQAAGQREGQLADHLVSTLLLEAAEARSAEGLAQQWISRLEKAFTPGAVMVARLETDRARLFALSGGGVISQQSSQRETLERLACLMADRREALVIEGELRDDLQIPSGLLQAALPQMSTLGAQTAVLLPIHAEGEMACVVVMLWDAEDAPSPRFSAALLDLLTRSLTDALVIFTRANPSVNRRLRNWCMGWLRLIFGKKAWKLKLAFAGLAVLLLALALIPTEARPGFPARVETHERRVIAAPWDGYLQSAPFRIGDTVPAGAVLLEMNSAEQRLQYVMAQAEAERLSAEARLALAQNDIARLRSLEAERAQNTLRLELLQRQITEGRVTAPDAMQVLGGEAYLREGARVRLGESLMELGNPAKLGLSAYIDEAWVADLPPGASARLVLAAWPDRSIDAVLEQITSDSSLSEGENRFRARLRLERPADLQLLDGMRGMVRIEAGRSTLLADYTRGLRRWFAGLIWRWS